MTGVQTCALPICIKRLVDNQTDGAEQTELPYQVRIENFEGPLDLLLHLIRKNEINIYDIPIAMIAQQYLSYKIGRASCRERV